MHSFSTKVMLDYRDGSKVSMDFFKRLIQFYQSQPDFRDRVSPIWKGVIDSFYKPLLKALEDKNAEALREVMHSLFLSEIVYGIDFGTSKTDAGIEATTRLCNDSMLYAASALGVIPEFFALQDNSKTFDHWELLDKMEKAMGMVIEHPGCGGVSGLLINGRFIPWKIFEVVRVWTAIPWSSKLPRFVAEVGAGTGFLAYLLCKAAKANKTEIDYHTIDLPIVSVIHGFMLAHALGEQSIHLCGEAYTEHQIVFIHGFEKPSESFNLILNENSLPEFPHDEAVQMLKWIEAALVPGGTFLSINHESDNGGQERVHELVEKNTKLICASRTPHFGRPGYVQEVYRV